MLELGQSLLTQLIDVLPDPMFLLSSEPDGRLRLAACNQALCLMLGLERDAVLNHPLDEIFAAADDAARWLENCQQVLASGQAVQLEGAFGANVQPELAFGTLLSPLFDDAGRCLYVCGLSRQLSSNPQAEKTLCTVNQELEVRLLEIRVLQEQVRQQAMRDPLTGLYNRRFFEDSLAREIFRARRSGYPLALLLIDVDHFKAFNDEHGHQVGDTVLQAVALHLLDNMRTTDVVCRYGGEEFAVMLPDMTAERALQRVEDWRQRVEHMTVQHENQLLSVCFSAGIAEFPGDAETAEDLIRAADKALYLAKNSGRDRACRYVPYS